MFQSGYTFTKLLQILKTNMHDTAEKNSYFSILKRLRIIQNNRRILEMMNCHNYFLRNICLLFHFLCIFLIERKTHTRTILSLCCCFHTQKKHIFIKKVICTPYCLPIIAIELRNGPQLWIIPVLDCKHWPRPTFSSSLTAMFRLNNI